MRPVLSASTTPSGVRGVVVLSVPSAACATTSRARRWSRWRARRPRRGPTMAAVLPGNSKTLRRTSGAMPGLRHGTNVPAPPLAHSTERPVAIRPPRTKHSPSPSTHLPQVAVGAAQPAVDSSHRGATRGWRDRAGGRAKCAPPSQASSRPPRASRRLYPPSPRCPPPPSPSPWTTPPPPRPLPLHDPSLPPLPRRAPRLLCHALPCPSMPGACASRPSPRPTPAPRRPPPAIPPPPDEQFPRIRLGCGRVAWRTTARPPSLPPSLPPAHGASPTARS